MKIRQKKPGAALLFATLIAPAVPTSAQNSATPAVPDTPRTIPGLVIATPTPVPSSTPVPVPTAPVRGLTLPTATPTVQQTPRPTRPKPSSVVEQGPTPAATPSSTPLPSASPTTMIAVPAPPIATPSVRVPVPTVRSAVSAPSARSAPSASDRWPWLAVAAVAMLSLFGWLWFRRRSDAPVAELDVAIAQVPNVPPPASPVAGPKARIGITFRATRAGLNMLSAIVEGEAIVVNVGDAPATQVRLHTVLLSAHAGQDAELAAAFAAPAGRPATAPFTLAPGEERRVRIVAVLPRDAIRTMEAGGRPMFVPLVAIDVRYRTDEAEARTGQAFVVGVERVDSAKLAPFWLDGPIRMHAQVAARAQGGALEG